MPPSQADINFKREELANNKECIDICRNRLATLTGTERHRYERAILHAETKERALEKWFEEFHISPVAGQDAAGEAGENQAMATAGEQAEPGEQQPEGMTDAQKMLHGMRAQIDALNSQADALMAQANTLRTQADALRGWADVLQRLGQ